MNVQNIIRSSIFLLSFQAAQDLSGNPFARIQQAENNASKKTPSANTTGQAKPSTAKQIPATYEQMIFVPTIPTTSSFSTLLQTMYSSTDLPVNMLQELQQVYFVLEYFAKLEKIQHDKKYASLQTKYASLLKPVLNDIPFISQGMDLAEDADWQKIVITQQDVINSDMWQYFLKATIADIFVHNGNFLQVIHEVETQIFNYIPSMETSYYNSDFLSLRNLAEGTRLKLLLNDIIGKKHQAQCVDWAKLSSKQLQTASTSFQSTDFYTYSHNITLWMQQDSKGNLISQKKVSLKSPTKEQVFCYAMIKTIQNDLYAALAESKNVENFITQASNASLLPNIFEYTLNEYVYLDDFFMIQANLATQIAENNQPETSTVKSSSDNVKVQSLQDHPQKKKHKKRYKPEELVKVQDAQLINPAGAANSRILELIYVAPPPPPTQGLNITSASDFFNELGNETSGFTQGVTNLAKKTGEVFQAAGQGIAGGVVTAVGDASGDQNLKNQGSNLINQASANANDSGIVQFGYSIADTFVALGGNLENDFVAAGYAIRDGIIQTGYAIRDSIKSVGEAIGGLGATIIGDIANDPNIQKVGHNLTQQALSDLAQSGTELNNAIDDYTKAIEDGIVAPQADIAGAFVSCITADQSIGLDMTTMINQVADSLSNFAATATKLLVSSVVEETADLITLGTDLTDAIVKSVAAMAYNNGAAVGSAWVQLGNDVATAALGAFNGLVNGSQELFASIMQVLTYLTSAITTIIIDVSREATFVGELIATGSVQEAKTEEASVATYLDNHRQTINMVSGIILAVAIDVAVTVATGGTGTAEAVALTEGMMTGADIAAGAAETGAEVAASAAADAATSAVETAVETGANAGDAVSGASNISRATSSITRNVGEDSGDSAGNLGSATRSGAKAPEPAPESPTEPIQTPQPAQPSKNLGSSSSSSSSDTSSAAANAAKTAGNTTKNTKSAADLTKEAATYTRTAANKAQDAAKTARASANAAKETATTARATASSSRSAANEADQAASQAEAEAEQAGTDAAKQAAQDARSKANQADQTATKAENIASKTDDAATKAEQGAKDAEDASNKAEAIATKAEKAANKPPMRGISHVVLSEGMNAVFNILGTIGASYQDELSAIQEISQEEGIKNIVSYAMDTALNSSLQQNAMMQETEKKFNANLVNQQINLTLLQDFATNTVINAAYQSEAIGLGQEYINLLTPQPIDSSDPKSQKYCPADIGSTWGLITQINSLYPQLGLYTTTAGRPLFPYAQEIAQAPLVIDTQTGSNTPTSIHAQAITQLWFNQRVMIPLSSHKATDTLDVEFQFRNLYSLQTTTYTGLYLGGIFEDYRSKNYLDNLETTGMANLNVTHLAKMFVLIHLPDGTCNVGLYEKDGLGSIKDPDGSSWIIYEPLAKDFTTGWPIYDMKATLQGNQLSLILSRTDMPTVAPWKKTVTVSPTDQRMLGVITSGTAIEWNILQPKLSIDQISSMRSTKTSQGASSNIIEKDREILSLQRWAQLLKPTFGVFTLTALSKYQCMKGNFVYTTTNTGIKESSNQAVVDYVVFANNATSGITNVGVNPCATTTDTSTLVLLSLGSGNVYDATGKIIGHQNNLWDTYNKAHGPFASSIASDITTMQTACLALLMKPKVGVFTLDAADNTLISNELYVYTTTQTLSAKGQKNLITDYLVSSTITTASDGNKYPETVGAPPSGNTQGLLSLVTGNLYSANSLTPLNTGLEGLRIYQNSYQNLPADITKKITDSLNAYTLATNPPTATQAPVEKKPTPKPPKAIVVGSILSDNIAGTTGGISLPTDLFDLPQAKTQASAPPSTASITLQQNVASGGISFDMNLMLGNPSDSAENNPTSSTNDQATSVGKNQDTSTNTAKPTSDSNNSNSAAVSTPQPTTKTTSIKPTTNNSSTLPKKISSQPTKTTTATTTTSTTKNNSQKPQKSSKKT